MKIKIILLLFTLSVYAAQAQKLATEIIILKDSTIEKFTDVNELYFLHNRFNNKLQNLVRKLSNSTSQKRANDIIKKIASIKNRESAVILTLDHFFKKEKAVAGSNVENTLQKLAASNAYYLINQYFLKNSIDTNLPLKQFKQKIQDTLGWAYGYGAFYYLSPQDSAYLANMKKIPVDQIDIKIKAIIEKYLKQQTPPFIYDINAIINEIKRIPLIKDIQHDRCLTKTQQLPNWDYIGVIIVKEKDTVERVYSIQYGGQYKIFRLFRCISFPIKNNSDVLFYNGVKYGLHFVAKTRKQCEENEKRHQENMKKYEEWKKTNK